MYDQLPSPETLQPFLIINSTGAGSPDFTSLPQLHDTLTSSFTSRSTNTYEQPRATSNMHALPRQSLRRTAAFAGRRTTAAPTWTSSLPTLASQTRTFITKRTVRPSPLRQRPTSLHSPSSRRALFIQTEQTPNADALKFKPNSRVLPDAFPSPFIEYLNPRSTLAPPHPSPLASQLLAVDGVSAVFYGPDYITVTKSSDAEWGHVKPEVFSLITEAVTQGKPLVNTIERHEGQADDGQGIGEEDSLAYNENDSEVVSMIKELLETRIRPAIQEDGGDIEFRGLKDGWVMLKLRGACRTCDSSTVTLRNGIESMLMHYIEEVQGVQQVLDEEEEVAMREFQKFEERLRGEKGDAAVASTGGKGTLDAAP